MRRRHPYDEPLSFSTRDVAELLESAGYERFAAHVRRLGDLERQKAESDRLWEDRYRKVVERLHVYEPPVTTTPDRAGKPGPRSDG